MTLFCSCSCVLKIAYPTLTDVVFTVFIQKSRHSGIVHNFMNTYTIFTVLQIMLKCVDMYDISIE